MKSPRLTDLACTSLIDQAGRRELVILGVDVHGDIWIKQGDALWKKISREAEEYNRRL